MRCDASVGEPLATAPPLPPPEEEYLQALQVERGLSPSTLFEYARSPLPLPIRFA